MILAQNILFLLVSLIVFIVYRQGIKDGIAMREERPLPPVAGTKKEGEMTKEEAEFYERYNAILNYNFDEAGVDNE